MKTGKISGTNKTMKKLLSVLIFCLMAYNTLLAQDIKSDLAKIRESHTTKEFEANINYKFFTGSKLVEELNALHVFSKGDYYFKISDIEVINNARCQVIVNDFFKSVSVMPAGKENDFKKITEIPIDTTLKEVSSHSFNTISDKEGVYYINFKQGQYRKIELYFNTKTFLITKLKMFVSDAYANQDPDMANGILIIEYKGYKTKISQANKQLLSEKRVVDIKKDQATLNAAYKEYELNNYLDIKPE